MLPDHITAFVLLNPPMKLINDLARDAQRSSNAIRSTLTYQVEHMQSKCNIQYSSNQVLYLCKQPVTLTVTVIYRRQKGKAQLWLVMQFCGFRKYPKYWHGISGEITTRRFSSGPQCWWEEGACQNPHPKLVTHSARTHLLMLRHLKQHIVSLSNASKPFLNCFCCVLSCAGSKQ